MTYTFKKVDNFINWLTSPESKNRRCEKSFSVVITKSIYCSDWYHDAIGKVVKVMPGYADLYQVVTHNDLALFISKNNCRRATEHEIKFHKSIPF
jgi:hypothetical protein